MHDFSLMGIDIGTSAVKALLWRSDGNHRMAYRRAKGSYVFDQGTGVPEQNPVKLWRIVKECIHEVLKGCDAGSVAGVGLSGHGPSLAPVDRGGNAVGNIITWMDPRPLMGSGCQTGPTAQGGPSFEATAQWIDGQLQRVSGSECVEGHVWVLQPKDYIGLRLTGEMCIDSSAASCMKWQPNEGGRIDSSDSGARLFPRVADPWEAVGAVTARASEETGLPEGIPVAAGSVDAFVEALGAGLVNPGVVCDSTGTSTCVSAVAGDGCSLQTVRHVIPGARLIVSPISYSGGCLAWGMSLFYPDVYSSQQDWSSTVAEALDRSEPGASGLVFLPYLVGKRSPVAVPTATGTFLGLRPEHTSCDMLRAVLEGCTYAMRQAIDALGDSLEASEVRAVGSGARHDGWLQMKADVLNLPVVRMEVNEGTLLGAAILAGVAAKTFTSFEEAVDVVVLADTVFAPHRQCSANDICDDGYSRGYAAFCRAESALQEYWNDVAATWPTQR